MNISNDWKDYEILDMANGEKLERAPTPASISAASPAATS